MEYTWHQKVIRRIGLIDGHSEERLFISNSNESVFIDMKTFFETT